MAARLPMLPPSPPAPAPAHAALHSAPPSRPRSNSALFGIVTHWVATRPVVHPGVESPAAAAGVGAIPQRWPRRALPPGCTAAPAGFRPRWMAADQPVTDGWASASSSGAPTASPPALDAAEPPAPLAGWGSPPAGWGGGRAASPDGWLAGRAGCRPGWLGVGLPRGAGPPPTCPRGWLAARLSIGGWVFVCESAGEGRLLSDRVRMRARAPP